MKNRNMTMHEAVQEKRSYPSHQTKISNQLNAPASLS